MGVSENIKSRAAATGLTAIYTGEGKGKTTAALGLALRASGYGSKVCIIQFIKGLSECGEHLFINESMDNVEIHTLGKGFTWKSDDINEDIRLARQAWDFAKKKVEEAEFDLIILDELTYLISYNMINEDDVLHMIKNKDAALDLVITGRGATPAIMDAADLVTEMKEIKHPFKKGIPAKKGFDF